MTKNPFINALAATVYIIVIVLVMDYGTRQLHPANTIFIPIMVLSLFTLSAAVMGYLFLFQPAQLYFDNKKKEAINLFLQTVAVFAGITLLIFIALFSGILS